MFTNISQNSHSFMVGFYKSLSKKAMYAGSDYNFFEGVLSGFVNFFKRLFLKNSTFSNDFLAKTATFSREFLVRSLLFDNIIK